MSLAELENAVAQLPPDQLAEFRRWFVEHDMALWDGRIESDSRSGRLKEWIARAVEEDRAGGTTEI